MIYMRPTKSGYEAYDCYHSLVFSEKNNQLLFSFIETNTSKIKELLLHYYESVIDTNESGMPTILQGRTPAKQLIDSIKKEMENIHPYLTTYQYTTVFRMLAEHLNRQLVNCCNKQQISKELYEELLLSLVKPLFQIGTKPMPPICVPTSDVFLEKYYAQLKAMVTSSADVLGLDYIEQTRSEAERYIFWVLDRSCFRFRDIDRDTRVRLYSRVFHNSILSSDLRVEHCCYWQEPEEYDYFSHTASGQLLQALSNNILIEHAETHILRQKEQLQRKKDMATTLKALTSDTVELTQEQKDYLDEELDAAVSDTSEALFEEYRVSSFDQAIQLQLWLLTKSDTIIKRCRHCGRLFIAERLSSDYCNRVQAGESEPCDIVGPKKSFARLMDEDHILKTYNRVYKTIYARKKRGSISDDEFNRWKKEARSLLDKTRAGGMSEDDFESWLTQDIRAWGDFGK